MGAFSLDMLFLNGETAQSAFAVWGHGWFYLFDLVFMIFGLAQLLTTKLMKKRSYYLLSFILFAVLPSTVNSGESWYLLRTFLPNVLLLLVISWGILFFWSKIYFRIVICSIYILSAGYFSYYFNFRYPILGANISYLAERTVINYVNRVQQLTPEKQIVVYTIDPPVMFWNYLVYANQLTKTNLTAITEAENSGNYKLGKVSFINACPDLTDQQAVVITEQWRVPCEQSQSNLAAATTQEYEVVIAKQKGSAITVPSIVDNGAYFRIFNDPICDRKSLSNFIDINNAADFDQTHKSNKDFCEKWFSRIEL